MVFSIFWIQWRGRKRVIIRKHERLDLLKVSCNINIVHAGGGIRKHQSEVWWRRLCEGGGHAAAADSHVWGNRRCSARDSYVQDLLKGKSGSLMMHCVLWHQEELQKRIVEEQQNNNLSVEILNGNTESLTGLVGNAQALKEPGIDHSACQHYGSVCVAAKYKRSRHSGVHIHTEQPWGKCYVFSFPDTVGAQSVWRLLHVCLPFVLTLRPHPPLDVWLLILYV